MLTPNLIPLLDDKHLLSAAEAEMNPLTSTDLERELLSRFSRLLEERDQYAPLIARCIDQGIDADDLEDIFKAMEEFCCHDVIDLRAKLERADKFYDIASDAGDVIERLSSLVNSTQ